MKSVIKTNRLLQKGFYAEFQVHQFTFVTLINSFKSEASLCRQIKIKASVQTTSLRLPPVDVSVFHCLHQEGRVSWVIWTLGFQLFLPSLQLPSDSARVIGPSSCMNWDSIVAQQQVNLSLPSVMMAESKVKANYQSLWDGRTRWYPR